MKSKRQNGPKRKSRGRETLRRFAKNRPAMIGLVIFILLAVIAILADVIVDQSLTTAISGAPLQTPNGEHWFGTDHIGRDVFARIIHASRISLSIGFAVTAISLCIGALLGAAVGYFGGVFDNVVMRFFDMLACIPSMLLIMAIISALGVSLTNLLVAMTISSVPSYVRLVRASVISLSDVEYVQCARSYGSSSMTIILRHVLPNALGPIIVSAAGSISGTIIAAAGLSFLGFGVQAPTPEWGGYGLGIPEVYAGGALSDHVSRLCHRHCGYEHQPDRRRPAGRAGPETEGLTDE